jgi:hypothetical protein
MQRCGRVSGERARRELMSEMEGGRDWNAPRGETTWDSDRMSEIRE